MIYLHFRMFMKIFLFSENNFSRISSIHTFPKNAFEEMFSFLFSLTRSKFIFWQVKISFLLFDKTTTTTTIKVRKKMNFRNECPFTAIERYALYSTFRQSGKTFSQFLRETLRKSGRLEKQP
jgi:hypothetical protein